VSPASFQPLLRLPPLHFPARLQSSENISHYPTMAQQVLAALASLSRTLTLHGQDALRSSSQLATSHQTVEELHTFVTNIDASLRQLQTFRTQARAHQEALKIQTRTRPRSPLRPDIVPLSEVNGTSPSTSTEGPRNTLFSTEVITRDAANRSRTKAVAVVACSSRPRPSTSQHQSTEQSFPNQNHRHEPSGMLDASTATVGNHPQSPRSSAGVGLGLRNNISVDVSMPDTGGNSSRCGGNPTSDQGKRNTFNNEGNVGFETGESSQSNGHLDRVHRSNVRGGRLIEEVRTDTARPQQRRSVRPASPAAFPSRPRPRTLRGIASSRALNGGNRSQRSYTRTIREYKIHKPKEDPLLRRPLLMNGSVPKYV